MFGPELSPELRTTLVLNRLNKAVTSLQVELIYDKHLLSSSFPHSDTMSPSPERRGSPEESEAIWHPAHEWLEESESESDPDPDYDPTHDNDNDNNLDNEWEIHGTIADQSMDPLTLDGKIL